VKQWKKLVKVGDWVAFTWVDAQGPGNGTKWLHLKDIPCKLARVKVVGIVVAVSEEAIAVSDAVTQDDMCCTYSVMPKFSIENFTLLKKGNHEE
jgi:hypothetical protein